MNAEKLHKEDLGLKIPNNYFEESKKTLERNIKNNQIVATPFINKKPFAVWLSAAVITLLLGIALFNTFLTSNYVEDEDDILITSFFEDEKEVDTFITQYVEDEMLTEALFLK